MPTKNAQNVGEHSLTFVLGDWSHDGHGITEMYTVQSNRTLKETEAAYKKGVKKLGFDYANVAAEGYEESYIEYEHLKTMLEKGLTLEEMFAKNDYCLKEAKHDMKTAEEPGEGQIQLDDAAYIVGWLFVARLGDPDGKWQIAEKEPEVIHAGGYGLFST